MAFVFAAAYLATCAVNSGVFVAFPHIYHGVRFLQYISVLKYAFQVSDGRLGRVEGGPPIPLNRSQNIRTLMKMDRAACPSSYSASR